VRKKKENPFYKNRWEICYELINAGLFGASTLINAMINMDFATKDFLVAIVIAIGVFVYRIKQYWEGEKREYQKFMFRLI
jgi:hypothetical protein